MKSFIYRIFGTPVNFDDCLDLVKSKSVTKASLGLQEKGLIYESDFGVALYARIHFQLPNRRNRKARIQCGTLRSSWPYREREKIWDQANKKLDRFVRFLDKMGVETQGTDYCFGPEKAALPVGGAAAARPSEPTEKPEPSNRPKAVVKKPAYLRFVNDKLILRDELAVDRTLLANERTLLSYLRSAVALAIAGVSIINFAEQRWFWIFGAACLPVAVITSIVGALRYRTMSHSISMVRTTFSRSTRTNFQNGTYFHAKSDAEATSDEPYRVAAGAEG